MTMLVKTPVLKKKKTTVDPWSSMLGSLVAPGPSPTAQVNAQVKAAEAANAAAIAGQRLQYQNQAERAQGFAKALAGLTAPDPASIAAQYRESADRLRGFGTGLTGAVAEAQQSNADRIAQEVARVTGGLGNVASYDVPGLRNTAQMSGVILPASSLEEQAGQAYARAGAERAASVGNIGSIAQEYLRKIGELQADVTAKNAAVEATRPSLYLEAAKAAAENNRANIATYIQARYLANTLTKTKADIAAGKVKTKAAKVPVFDSTNSNSLKYRADQFGNPILDSRGRLQPLPGYKIDSLGTGVVKIGGTKTGSGSRMQSKTINGNTVLFDPGSGSYYLPGDTKNPIDPNTLTGKTTLTPDELRTLRAKAVQGIAYQLHDPDKGDEKRDPSVIYSVGVANGIPGWVMAQALRAEALNHPGDKAWENARKRGWVSGKKKKK